MGRESGRTGLMDRCWPPGWHPGGWVDPSIGMGGIDGVIGILVDASMDRSKVRGGRGVLILPGVMVVTSGHAGDVPPGVMLVWIMWIGLSSPWWS
jgi:hypothetical protein